MPSYVKWEHIIVSNYVDTLPLRIAYQIYVARVHQKWTKEASLSGR